MFERSRSYEGNSSIYQYPIERLWLSITFENKLAKHFGLYYPRSNYEKNLKILELYRSTGTYSSPPVVIYPIYPNTFGKDITIDNAIGVRINRVDSGIILCANVTPVRILGDQVIDIIERHGGFKTL